jgi:DNA-binding IclR family transcriptional regulator
VGRTLATIRERGWQVTVGEADAGSASIAAPVFTSDRTVLGAMSLVVPADTKAVEELERHAPALVEAAQQLSRALASASFKAQEGLALRGSWHPE